METNGYRVAGVWWDCSGSVVVVWGTSMEVVVLHREMRIFRGGKLKSGTFGLK
jgi:hypothetical protein